VSLLTRDPSFIVIFVITEYLLKYSVLIKCLITMNSRLEKLAAMLAMIVILLTFTLANVEIAFSQGAGGNVDLFTQKELFSGRGPNMPSDAFGPGDIVILYSLVTYGEVSVPNLIVTFHVEAPDSSSFSLTARTNASGIATINFSIPQRHEDLTDFFGEWSVLTNVLVMDDLLQDSLTFRVDWVVKLLSVRVIDENLTSRSEFGIGGDVGLEIALRSIAMSIRNATLAVVVQDELTVPVSSIAINYFEVQPNEKMVFLYCKMYIPKWTHIGNANAIVSVLTAPADQGGVSFCPALSAEFLVSVYQPLTLDFRDAAIVKIVPSVTSVMSGEPVSIGITVRNEGTTEESFNVRAYHDDNLIGTSTVTALEPYSSMILLFTFNTTGLDPGNYTINAFIPYLIGEADLTDNQLFDGVIEIVPAIKQYYLTVRTDPYDVTSISGEGLYNEGVTVTLTAPEYVLVSTGVRYRFSHWDVDETPSSDNPIPVIMDTNHVATAHYVLQNYLFVISPYGNTGGEGWYDTITTAYATLDAGIVDLGNGTRRVFTHWSSDAFGTDYAKSNPIIMDRPKTAVANWKVQYGVIFNHTGLDSSALGWIVTINENPKTFGELPYTLWVDHGAVITYTYSDISSSVTGKRFILTSIIGLASPMTVTNSVTVSGNYKSQYYLAVETDPSGLLTIPGEGWYDQFENVLLTASPVDKYDFGYWDVDGVSRSTGVKTITVYMDSPHVATAHFSLRVEGWYVPEWFYWLLLLSLSVALMIFLIALLYRRRRRTSDEDFYKGWAAWYYGYDLRRKTR